MLKAKSKQRRKVLIAKECLRRRDPPTPWQVLKQIGFVRTKEGWFLHE